MVRYHYDMARQTNTRALVREAADRLFQAGELPSPTRVRALLGAGSPNTIVDELRKWRQDNGLVDTEEASLPAPLPRAAPSPPPVSPVQQESAPSPSTDVNALESLIRSVEALTRRLDEQLEAQASAERRIQVALEQIVQRFDGVQRHMLLQVDEARALATSWKERHTQTKEEFSVWRDTLQAQLLRASEENAWLRGKQGLSPRKETLPVMDEIRAAPRHQSPKPPQALLRPQSTYPGHPRAVGGAMDDDYQE